MELFLVFKRHGKPFYDEMNIFLRSQGKAKWMGFGLLGWLHPNLFLKEYSKL